MSYFYWLRHRIFRVEVLGEVGAVPFSGFGSALPNNSKGLKIGAGRTAEWENRGKSRIRDRFSMGLSGVVPEKCVDKQRALAV